MITNMRLFRMLCAALVVGSGVSPAQTNISPITQDLQWRLVGPFRGGRTRAITGVPGQPHTFLTGAVNGGVWKTDDDGRTWTPIFDSQPTQSIGAIAVAPSDPRIIYVASGEGLHRPDLSVGNGVYRSSDGGKSWRVGRAATAGSGMVVSRNPLATFSANGLSMFNRCDTIRRRMATVSTLLSSNVSALAMCVCSIGVWLI